MLNTIAVEIVEPIVEEIKEKYPKWEMPALLRVGSFWIFILDLMIILSAMSPKMTFDECKKMHDGKKRWYDAVSLASCTVSFQRFCQMFKNCGHDFDIFGIH